MKVSHCNQVVTWELNRPEQDNGLDLATIRSMELSLTTVHSSVLHGIKSGLRVAAPRVMTRTETEEFQRAVINRLVTG